jgi:hypothetical protein
MNTVSRIFNSITWPIPEKSEVAANPTSSAKLNWPWGHQGFQNGLFCEEIKPNSLSEPKKKDPDPHQVQSYEGTTPQSTGQWGTHFAPAEESRLNEEATSRPAHFAAGGGKWGRRSARSLRPSVVYPLPAAISQPHKKRRRWSGWRRCADGPSPRRVPPILGKCSGIRASAAEGWGWWSW